MTGPTSPRPRPPNPVAWVTDIHLNFVDTPTRQALYDSIRQAKPAVLLVGGDMGEAQSLELYLLELEQHLPYPIYFVLGNHDFYGSSFQSVYAQARRIHEHAQRLHWLPACGVVPLTEQTGLIGHGAWADGRLGLGLHSTVILNDYYQIWDFRYLSNKDYFERLNTLGDEAADHFRTVLPEAVQRFRHVVLLTHVPPFREACWHEGRISDDNHLPHFSCLAVGEVLLEIMRAHPDRELTVLCGHTHSPGSVRILPNLLVKTGGALYGEPHLQEVMSVP